MRRRVVYTSESDSDSDATTTTSTPSSNNTTGGSIIASPKTKGVNETSFNFIIAKHITDMTEKMSNIIFNDMRKSHYDGMIDLKTMPDSYFWDNTNPIMIESMERTQKHLVDLGHRAFVYPSTKERNIVYWNIKTTFLQRTKLRIEVASRVMGFVLILFALMLSAVRKV